MLGVLLQNVTIVTKSFDSITKCVGTKEDLIEQLIFDKCYKRSWAPSTGTPDLIRYRNIRSHKATVSGTELFISAIIISFDATRKSCLEYKVTTGNIY